MKIAPRVCILKTDGINCDAETAAAFRLAGGKTQIVHVNQLRSREESLQNYQILAIPGGFSYGDDIASGKILATELVSYLGDQINEFTQSQKGLVLGVCNGFQTLIRTGLLPFGTMGEMHATLMHNESGNFECRPINLRVAKDSACVFLQEMDAEITLPVAHGEGKLYAPQEIIKKIEQDRLVVFRYVNAAGEPTQHYPDNPNGSVNAIAGITDPSGRILGLMPHPERAVSRSQHPNWRRLPAQYKPQGLPLFQGMINYTVQM